MNRNQLADWLRSISGWARKQALNPIMKTGLIAAMILLILVLLQDNLPAQVAAAPSRVPSALGDATVAVVGTTTVDYVSFGGVSLTCPAGQVAVGGGIDPYNVFHMFVTSSGPTWGGNRLLDQPVGANPAPDGWEAYMYNGRVSGLNVPLPVNVAVICMTSSSVTSVVGTTNVPDNNFGGVSLACPAGQVAVGGGIDPNNVFTEFVTSSGPTWGGNRLLDQPVGANPAPDGWEAYIFNNSGATAPVKVAVICVTSSSVTSVVGTTTVNDVSFGGVSLTCPAGQVAVGGGIDPNNVLTERVTSSGPTWGGNRLLDQPVGANPAPDGWEAYILNNSGATAPVNVAVICMPANSTAANSIFLPLIVR